MEKDANRFVDVKHIQELLKEEREISVVLGSIPSTHCWICGDTKPKHGFYPLWGMAFGPGIYRTSGWRCNRCSYSDEDYNRVFKEPKENI